MYVYMYLVNKSNSDCSDTKKKVTNGENLFFVQASVRRNIYRFTLMEKLVGLPTMNAFYLATVLIIKLIINCWLCYLAQLRLKVTGKQPEYFKLR